MATKTFKGFREGSIVVKSPGNTYNITQDATIISSHVDTSGGGDPIGAIMEDMTATPKPKGNVFNVDGHIIGFQVGIVTMGAGDVINIGEEAEIDGAYGIYMTGNKSSVVNRGHISTSTGYGVYGAGNNQHVENHGTIDGLAGIAFGGDKAYAVNGVDGVIHAVEAGVLLGANAGMSTKFANHGLIVVTAADGVAVSAQAGNDTVTNDGTLRGGVDLGEGNDVLDNRNGKIAGSIVGGLGDDTLVTNHAGDKLVEDTGEGTDTVKSSVSYTLSENVEKLVLIGKANINGSGLDSQADILVGNTGNNTLNGHAGMDDLAGGKGNDILKGGADADTFHFSTGDGHDTISDFTEAVDKLDFSHWTGLTSLTAVTDHAVDKGDDTLITVGHDTLLLRNIHEGQLSDGDFVYSAT